MSNHSMMVSTGTLFRQRIGVLKIYPWLNGLHMTSGDLEPYLKPLIRELNLTQGEASFILELALRQDQFNLNTQFDSRQIKFLEKYLAIGNGTETTASLKSIGQSNSRHVDLLTAAHVVLRYSLLDKLCDALGLPVHEELSQIPITAAPKTIPIRFEKVQAILIPYSPYHASYFGQILNSLSSWTKPIEAFRKHALASRNSINPLPELFVDSNLRDDQKVFKQGLLNLVRGVRHCKREKHEKTMYNLELTGFALSWLRCNFDLPDDPLSMRNAIFNRAKELDMDIEEEHILDQLNLPDQKEALTGMLNALHLAIFVSPLLLLSPVQYETMSIRRDYLIGVSIALGNTKPLALQTIERKLWRALLNISLGFSAEEQMNDFISAFESLATADKHSDWFMQISKSQYAKETAAKQAQNLGTLHIQEIDREASKTNSMDPNIPTPTPVPGPSVPNLSPQSPANQEESPAFAPGNEDNTNAEQSADKGQTRPKRAARQSTFDAKDVATRGANKKKKFKSSQKTQLPKGGKTDFKDQNYIIDLTGDNAKESVVMKIQEPKIAPSSIQVKLFYGEPDKPARHYEFTTFSNVSEKEYRLLQDIQESVESGYQNGVPPHHLPSAREVQHDAQGSSIFVVDHVGFKTLSARTIQHIFRHRHILVLGIPTEPMQFDRDSLSMLGPLHHPIQMQFVSLRNENNGESMLRYGTLEDMYKSSQDQENKRIVNALDCEMGHISVPPPPQYRLAHPASASDDVESYMDLRHLATHERALVDSRGQTGLRVIMPLTDQMVWGTAALKDATTWGHIDDDGFGTVVNPMVGGKYWVLMRPRRNLPKEKADGKLASLDAFETIKGWGTAHGCREEYEHEGVLLVPGSVLYMKPNTPHYVLTVDHSITYGRHFYASSTMQNTALGIVHSFVLGYSVTNVQHENTRTLVRRIMTLWFNHFCNPSYVSEGDEQFGHIPDIETEAGLFDIITVGNILEFAEALNRRTYISKVDRLVREEQNVARHRYLLLTRYFCEKYVTSVGGIYVEPSYVFQRSIVDFAAALVAYKHRQPKAVRAITPTNVEKFVRDRLENAWPELVPRFRKLLADEADHSLAWQGPPIRISLRESVAAADGHPEDHPTEPIFSHKAGKAKVIEPNRQSEQGDSDDSPLTCDDEGECERVDSGEDAVDGEGSDCVDMDIEDESDPDIIIKRKRASSLSSSQQDERSQPGTSAGASKRAKISA